MLVRSIEVELKSTSMVLVPLAVTIGSFSNDNGNGKENVTLNKHLSNCDYLRLSRLVRIL